METKREGWSRLWNLKKLHYFRNEWSLCEKWAEPTGHFYLDPMYIPGYPDYCKTCERKRLKELESK